MARHAQGETVILDVNGKPRQVGGWLAPQPHHRLLAAKFAAGLGVTPESKGFAVPGLADNWALLPRVFDQGPIGDCTAHAGVTVAMATRAKFGLPDVELSRLDLYARTRKNIMKLGLDQDSGATVTDMMMALMQLGIAEESAWPSVAPENRFRLDPDAPADESAAKHKGTNCYALTDLSWTQANLGLGFCAALGFSVPEHFGTDTARTGQLRMPEPGEAFTSGHCVAIYGVDMSWDNTDGTTGAVVARNSWSEDFGLRDVEWNGRKRPGDFMMPVQYIVTWLAQDIWCTHWETKGF